MGFGIDLMILDIPNDLHVPHMSSPITDVFDWKKLHPKFLDNMFDFIASHLQDVGAILLFFSDDLKLKATLRGFNHTYGFIVFTEQMGINRLQMTSAKDKSTTICIQILILICNVVSVLDGF